MPVKKWIHPDWMGELNQLTYDNQLFISLHFLWINHLIHRKSSTELSWWNHLITRGALSVSCRKSPSGRISSLRAHLPWSKGSAWRKSHPFWMNSLLKMVISSFNLGNKKILYSVWSPPWHLYIFLLANLLAFYLTYLLAFYLAFYLAYLLAYVLAYLLAFYLTYLLAFYLAYLLAYVLAYLLAFYLAYLLAFYLANLLAFCLAFYLTYLLAFYLAYLLAFYLAVEVQQCPLRPGSRGWGPAVPTAIWKSRLRSGSAHCNLEVAVEVRQCPLRSGARGGGPAVPTGIWTARRRTRRRWRRRRRRRRTALIKSNNPHLAGGEQSKR